LLNVLFVILFLHSLIHLEAGIVIELAKSDASLEIKKDKISLYKKNNVLCDSIVFYHKEIKSIALSMDSTKLFLVVGAKNKFYGDALKIYVIKDNKLNYLGDYINHGQNPWKVRIGDLNNDGRNEVVVGVWKKVRLEKRFRKRLFIYTINKEGLKPIWLSSLLSSPFYDFEIWDIDNDKRDDVITLELQKNGLKRICVYSICSFGLKFMKILQKDVNLLNLESINFQKEYKK